MAVSVLPVQCSPVTKIMKEYLSSSYTHTGPNQHLSSCAKRMDSFIAQTEKSENRSLWIRRRQIDYKQSSHCELYHSYRAVLRSIEHCSQRC